MNTKLFQLTVVMLLGLVASPAMAQRLDASRFRDGKEVKNVFRPLLADATKATVRVKCGGKDAALGTIVGSDGYILTKASELRSPVICRLHDGQEFPATLVGVQASYDLALLKIEAQNLPVADWAKSSDPKVGQLLAASTPNDDPLAMGVVSVPRRKIPGRGGVLGIVMDESDKGPRISQVFPGSGAEKAGLKTGDIVQKVADQVIKSREILSETIRSHKPGDTVRLYILRGEDVLDITATLTLPPPTSPTSKSEDQNTMGGPLSIRNTDFPLVMQHDMVLKPTDCGGPIVDLSGKVVGVNIARAGRVESYAVPADQIIPLLPDLMSGKLAPKDALASADPKKVEEKKEEKKPEEKKPEDQKAEQKKPADPKPQDKPPAENKPAVKPQSK